MTRFHCIDFCVEATNLASCPIERDLCRKCHNEWGKISQFCTYCSLKELLYFPFASSFGQITSSLLFPYL